MTATPLPPDPLASVEADLSEIDTAPLAEQAEIFDRIHRTISQVLQSTADRSGAPAPGAGPGGPPDRSTAPGADAFSRSEGR